MRRILLVLLVLLLLCGCGKQPEVVPVPTETKPTETTAPETTAVETTVPETTEPTVPETTLPEHSDLYLPDTDVEDVISWFSEVCLDSEFLNFGESSTVQKWGSPIRYYIHGEPTQEDLEKIEEFAQWLNTLEGFPGISRVTTPETANLQIHFTSAQELVNLMGPNFENADGGFTYWTDDCSEVFDAIICIRSDLDQYLRNSVILEELYNCIGARQDTILRPDSLIYQEFSMPQEMTAVDELIIRILYHPQILCGMAADECATVIRSIYY